MENLTLDKIKVSAVSYLNTLPLIYGLTHSKIVQKIDLSLDNPSACARKLIKGEVDLGLVPVASIPQVPEARIIGNYCIGADGAVKTVLLLSNFPFDEIKTIYLDAESRTSVRLVQVLAAKYWKRGFQWKSMLEYDEDTSEAAGLVLIGDKTFIERPKFKCSIDLAEEWKRFTGMPFVFACWVANKKLSQGFIDDFDTSIAFGLENIEASVDEYANGLITKTELLDYLKHSISFDFDDAKKEAMKLFLKLDKECSAFIPNAK
jgi:chorismate dehydratase